MNASHWYETTTQEAQPNLLSLKVRFVWKHNDISLFSSSIFIMLAICPMENIIKTK